MTDEQQPAKNLERKQRRKERKHSVHGGGSVYLRRGEGKERWVAAMKDPETGKRLERYAKSQKRKRNPLGESGNITDARLATNQTDNVIWVAG